MANYNPHAPYILGEEWVPIRQPGLLPNNVTERGYTTGIDHTAVVVSGAFYVQDPPPAFPGTIAEIMAVYPAGTENQTGPIRQVTIACDAATATGTGTGGNPGITAGAVASPADFEYISISPPVGGGSQQIGLSFDVASYTAELNGKRILNVELLYVAAGLPSDLAQTNVIIGRASNLSNGQIFYEKLTGSSSLDNSTQVNSMSFGELNLFHSSTVVAPGVPTEPWAYPWRYNELALFDGSATPLNQKLIVVIQNQGNESTIYIGYAALRVTYCEEHRVAYGAMRTLIDLANSFNAGYQFIPLKTPAFAVSATLTPGRYTVVQSLTNLGGSPSPYAPNLAALQELYELPTLNGIQINRSLTVDTTFTDEYSDTIPALTLHTTTAVVTGSHPYGAMNGAPIYDGFSANQDVSLRPAGASATYPWVRFYARRFSDTTQPLVLQDVATGVSTVSLTVADFDALPEIIDGWREVTLRFATPPTFANGSGDINWIWQSTLETAGNQWQVLLATMRPPLPAGAQVITPSSYWAPDGTAVDLVWKSPNVTVNTEDTTADAIIIFSQDPPTVTGFSVTTAFQEVAQVGLNCGTPNGCIPTGIARNAISWDLGAIIDTFTDDVPPSSWGTTDTGETWTAIISANSSIQVSGGLGHSYSGLANETNYMTVPSPGADTEQRWQFIAPAYAVGGVFIFEVLARFIDINNNYSVQVLLNADGTVTFRLRNIVGGAGGTMASMTVSSYTPNVPINVVFNVTGSTLSAKMWFDGSDEPTYWMLREPHTTLTAAGSVGVRIGITTTAPTILSADNFYAVPASIAGGSLDLERWDAIDNAWHQIMRTYDVSIASFNDYEARVGVLSLYRIRVRNVLDFYGPWVSGSGTIPVPGVQIPGDGNSVLIFTSNVGPTGNLAYIMSWENRPIESFIFPEADTVQLQRMYGKNFMTAFRPLERGGERFQRTILVNAAAIPLPSLANFRGLRDLAWADLPYVCVRDELGNRWYATVIVPSGEVAVDRQLYLAQIDVAETSDTPFPVDPA